MQPNIKINEEQALNPSIYLDKPITGGKTALVINKLEVRQAIRTPLAIDDWNSAIINAISRYFPNRRRLYDIYESALNDGHLTGILQKRMDTILNKPLFYKDKHGSVVGEMNSYINSLEFRKIMRLILESLLWGISGLEFVPGEKLHCRSIPRKHIKTRTQKIVVEQNSQDEGFDYTKLDNVLIVGEAEDLGLLLQCSMCVTYKRAAIGDWATFIEMFGQPIRVVRYDPNDETSKTSLENLGAEAGGALFALIPKTADFELLSAGAANANGDLQAQFIDLMNEEMSITILGNTETTSGGSSSLAKSKTHAEQQSEISKSDIRFLEGWLNNEHFTKILQSYGLPVTDGGQFRFNKDIDVTFLSERAKIDHLLQSTGLNIPASYFYETYNIPVPGGE